MLYSSSKTEHFSVDMTCQYHCKQIGTEWIYSHIFVLILIIGIILIQLLKLKKNLKKKFGVFFIISLTVLTFYFTETNGRPEKMLFIWTKPSNERLLYRSPELLQSSRSLCVPQTSSSSISCWLRKQYVTLVYTCKEYIIYLRLL